MMIYIHGGSYRVGSGSVYPGYMLAQHGVVVVTFNYRLALLGRRRVHAIACVRACYRY